jgi:hypothetical protein
MPCRDALRVSFSATIFLPVLQWSSIALMMLSGDGGQGLFSHRP